MYAVRLVVVSLFLSIIMPHLKFSIYKEVKDRYGFQTSSLVLQLERNRIKLIDFGVQVGDKYW